MPWYHLRNPDYRRDPNFRTVRLMGERVTSYAQAANFAMGKYPVNCQWNRGGVLDTPVQVDNSSDLWKICGEASLWRKNHFVVIRRAGKVASSWDISNPKASALGLTRESCAELQR